MKFEKRVLIGVVLVAVLVNSSESLSDVEVKGKTMKRYRLPNDTIPRLYSIQIEPKIGDFPLTWTGSVDIAIEVVNSVRLIILHAHRDLSINEKLTEIVGSDGIMQPARHERNDTNDFLKLRFRKKIPVGNYTLRLHFNGSETSDFDDKYGLCKFSGSDEDSPMVVGTRSEPTGMRRIFPCWDEPGFKARFSTSIVHSPNYEAISNMPKSKEIMEREFHGQILTTFETTPPMSTYLVNIVIADYAMIKNEQGNVSLFGSSRWFETARYMLDFTEKVVKVMQNYTGHPIVVPGIGSVLMPEYPTSATEYWGLITYTLEVLIDETQSGIKDRDTAYMTVAHEISHSWFGNLVSPNWWSDVWLSEGFATYFSYYIMDEIFVNWGGSELFVLANNQDRAFVMDERSDNPVVTMPRTREDLLDALDQIRYRKGAAIVHMMRSILGDDVFRIGIQNYLAKHSFKSVATSDLFAALQESYDRSSNEKTPLNLATTMTSWLTQSGYPLVRFRRNYTSGVAELFQKRNHNNDGGEYFEKWWIPLTYATKSNPNFTSTLPIGWMTDKDESAKLRGIDKDDWIVLNVRASGYYRVDYDDGNWNRLIKYLNTDNYKNIHVLNRVQLIRDAVYFFFVEQTEPNFKVLYKLLEYLTREVDYLPWRAALHAIDVIEAQISLTELHTIFRKHFLELMQSFVEKVGFEIRDTDDHFTNLSRTDVINWACRAGHSGCSEYAAKKLIGLMEFPAENRLHPDAESWTYCAGLRGLNHPLAVQFADWAYGNVRTRHLLINSIGCTENHEVHTRILSSALLTSNSEEPDSFGDAIPQLLASSDENYNFTIDYLTKNYESLTHARTSIQMLAVMSLPTLSTRSRARVEKYKELLQLDEAGQDLGAELGNLSAQIREAEETPVFRFTSSYFSVRPGRKNHGYSEFIGMLNERGTSYRLPNNTIPRRYSIEIEADISPKAILVMESYMKFPSGVPTIGSTLMRRERPVSFNSTVNTTRQKDMAEMTVAREIAHTWFGNRVTPLWSNDLWITEGFATYFGYYIMNEIRENWGGFDLFIVMNNQETAFVMDHEMQFPVRWTLDPRLDISDSFVAMANHKGAAIVHMFRNVLGDKIFQSGVQNFMAKHSFKAATAIDLIAAFQEAYDVSPDSGNPLDISEAMTPWLVQSGYPVISVWRNTVTGDVEVVQQNMETPYKYYFKKWWVPLTYATKSDPNFTSTLPVGRMTVKDDSVRLRGIDKDDWILLNIRASGYYRVDYDDGNWNKLFDYLNSESYSNIHVLNRVQLISDAFYFLASHKTNRYYNIFYKLTKYLSREVDYLPWRAVLRAVESIEPAIVTTEVHVKFQKYFLRLMERFVEKVGFDARDGDDHFTNLSRTDVIDWACRSGHSGCSEYSAKKLIGLMENPTKNRLHPDTASWTFCAGLRGLNDTAVEIFADWAYQSARELLEKNVGCTENHKIHRKILNDFAKNGDVGHSQKFDDVFVTLLRSSDDNFNFTVDFFRKNHEAIQSGTGMEVQHAVILISQEIQRTNGMNKARLAKFKEVMRFDAVRQKLKDPDGMEEAVDRLILDEDPHPDFIQTSKHLSDDSTVLEQLKYFYEIHQKDGPEHSYDPVEFRFV